MEERGNELSKVSSQPLGKKGAIYSLPQKLAVGNPQGRKFRVKGAGTSGRGPDIPGLTPEFPVPRKFPEQTSGAKFRTPTREENAKDLAKISLGRIFRVTGPELPVPRKFPEQTSGQSSGPPPERKKAKDLAKKAQMKIWAGYSGARAGTSWGRNFRPPGRNFRPTENKQKLQCENGHIFYIRTPFSMILGSLDSQRKTLQDHAEKHHCPSCEEEIIRREFDLS